MLNLLAKISIVLILFILGACAPEQPESVISDPKRPESFEKKDKNTRRKERRESQNRELAEDTNNAPDLDPFIKAFIQSKPSVRNALESGDIFRIYKPGEIKDSFDDVIGLKEAKNSLKSIISSVSNPQEFGRLGAKPHKGVIFYGPPGTGKTAIARAFAGEVSKTREITFIVASGSSFDNKYVGVGADNLRKLFALAREHKPCVIFIDEFDAVGGKRSEDNKNTQTVNQLLTELDGFSQEDSTDIFFIAATNLLENIDPAVKRSGRIDRKIEIPLPDAEARRLILEHYMAIKPAITGIDLITLVEKTKGFNAADLKTMVNEARIHATENSADHVVTKDFEKALIFIKNNNVDE